MHRYPAIEDHGLVGDLQAAAPGPTEGTVGWFCPPSSATEQAPSSRH